MKQYPRMFRLFALVALWSVVAPITAPHAQERIQDESARSDFIYRVNLGRADDVRLLMRQGASPNQVSGEGVPVLCLAAGRIDPEGINVIQALLEAGANIEARDNKGQTALFYAAKNGNIESITYLLENKLDSYALDNNGDVARNAAYKAGQRESVKAIDDFILRQTAEVTQAYKQRNIELANSRNTPTVPTPETPVPKTASSPPPAPPPPEDAPEVLPEDPVAPTAPEEILPVIQPEDGVPIPEDPVAPTAPEEILPVIQPDNGVPIPEAPAEPASPVEMPVAPLAPEIPSGPGLEPGPAAPAPAAPETPEAKAERLNEERRTLIYDMAFNVCAFQYWSYCSSARQSVDLDKEELLVAIDSSKSAGEALKRKLNKNYSLPLSQVETISSSAQQRIYKELNTMSSNRDRHEKGVGRRDDMQERCSFIARQWGEKAPGRLVDPQKASGSRGSSGAGKSGGAKSGRGGSKSSSSNRAGPGASKKSGGKGSAPAAGPYRMI